jgi:hypothetical protein
MMSVNKKRMIPVLSVVLVTLMALMATVPAFAATGTKGDYLSPSKTEPALSAEPVLGTEPAPKALMRVAKIGVVDLPWFGIDYRKIAIHVVIYDQSDRAVQGAEVTGNLAVGAFEIAPLTARTDSHGEAVVEALIPRKSGAKFCVLDVVKDGYAYDAANNDLTCVIILPQERG